MARNGKVSVIGSGFYGTTTAQRLAEYDIFDTVVLTDILEGKPEGIALDINQSRSIEGYETKVVGATTQPDGSGYELLNNDALGFGQRRLSILDLSQSGKQPTRPSIHQRSGHQTSLPLGQASSGR